MSNSLPLICENPVPDRYYKLIHRIDPDTSEVYVFVGHVTEEVREALNAIQKNQKLSSNQEEQLTQYFGLNYKKILALEGYLGTYPPIYIDDLIEVDDSIAAIKNKIATYLRMLVEWEYLYVNIDTDGKKQSVCLGHTFIERKETKKSDDVLIEYPKDPFINIDLNHPSMNYFVDSHTGTKSTGYQ